jgi:hypothetical protein
VAGAEPAGQPRDEKNTYRYGTKHIYKSKYTKYTRCRPLLAIKLKYRKNIHHCNAIQIFYIQVLLPQTLLNRNILTQKNTNPLIHRDFYTQTLLHTNIFTQRRFYTENFTHKQPDPFTHKDLHTKML